MIKFIDELQLKSHTVIMRVDFNVPLDADCNITDDNRIQAAMPTVRHALNAGARLLLCSHLGRPKGQRVEKFSLAPVATRLSEILGFEVPLAPDCIGRETASMAAAVEDGKCLMLENLRYHSGETDNDPEFAASLAELAEVYVNDAFAVSHRAHASVVGVPALLKECAGGFLMKSEITYFNRAMKEPARPLVAILGGAKVSSKLGAIENILPKVDALVIGGAMANTFLMAKGYSVGKSLVESDLVETAEKIMKDAEARGVKFLLPVDAFTAPEFSEDAPATCVSVESVPDDSMILDIGPETLKQYCSALEGAGTIVWNGPMGAFEMKPFSTGTMELAHAVGRSTALSIIGGGDTDLAVHMAGEKDNVSYMSTGGGAFLSLLEGKTLPGFEALEKCGSSSE